MNDAINDNNKSNTNNKASNSNNDNIIGNKINIFQGNNSYIYNEFLGDQFNVVNYTSNALKVSSISSSLDTLVNCSKELSRELEEEINNNYKELFQLSYNVNELDGLTFQINSLISSLESSITRMKGEIISPYSKVRSKVEKLKNSQEACELLRQVVRYTLLVKKLKTYLQHDVRDLPKSAQCINELNLLKDAQDLKGIKMIDEHINWVKLCGERIIVMSSTLLVQGMENQNQSDVSNSLQVFFNLGILNDKVISTLNSINERATKNIKALLNVNKLIADFPKSGFQQQQHNQQILSTSFNKENSIWPKFEQLMDTLYTSLIQILHLQRLLLKTRDQQTQKPLMEYILIGQYQQCKDAQQIEMLSTLLWKSVLKVMENSLVVAAKSSNIIENIFVQEYPKVSKYFLDLSKKIQSYIDIHQMDVQQPFLTVLTNLNQLFSNSNNSSGGNSSNEGLESSLLLLSSNDYKVSLFKTIQIFEKSYLDYNQSKLASVVTGLFPQSSWSIRSSSLPTIPNPKQLVELSKSIWSEIELIIDDKALLGKLVIGVCKTIDLFSSKIELMLSQLKQQQQQLQHQSNEISIDSKPNQSQIINSLLFNASIELYNSINTLLTSHRLEPNSIQSIESSLNSLMLICKNIITPLINSFFSQVEHIISTVHNDQLYNEKYFNKPNQICSTFMENLKNLINNFHSNYLVRYTRCHLLTSQLKSVISKMFIVFLRHCSLLEPLSENGKLKLVNDLTHLEFSVTPLLPDGLKEIDSYNLLKDYKQSIFKEK
ncbi:hypothetical protein DICPUDRAFT_78047 [Dictyostelium purpureum]|uniref:Conserved oligomeric Golgi complex subunit 5 n=1 Tax=Dictyostelium purpureum TaxID=5786 RepID=F0ZIE3_DICPU|nr:uncharacterized protein DICPUDRAFT_78047 [Dictyostelium purpureum]EGC36293.1 hypothetical protein DICPUDRAFT_78047 [Dictyostelium purpureum]|eukprot:XP_003287171.1 hypothetical protein DICPUDRAFT_78047 [Dictyostelium purpureum]